MSKDSGAAGKKPSLDDLFRTGRDVDDGELAAKLLGKVYFGAGEVSRVFIEDSFMRAAMSRRLLAVALGLHVLKRKGLIEDPQLARPAFWFADQVQAMPKSVAESLSRLKAKGYFERIGNAYRLPNWAVKKALLELDESGEDQL